VSVRLATGPVTWGVDFADAPDNPPWPRVLDEIAASGLGALELGPVGYLPEAPGQLRAALRSRGLTAVGSFVFEDLHDPTRHRAIASVAERACAAIRAAGGRVLVIIDRPGPARAATAGRSDAALRLTGSRWRILLDAVARVAVVARDHGLRPVVHPHAGSFLEFEDEIERLLAETDLDLCLDTGHLAYARVDPLGLIARAAPRIGHVHLKDADGAVLARVDEEALHFWAAVEAGVFCPLGAGVVDLHGVLAALARHGYDGFATIEQDRVRGTGTPLADLRRSVHACRCAMVAAEPAR
jgi:inosose dehydratase